MLIAEKHTRFLVTGGAGFLGSHVVEQLRARGYSDISVLRSREYDLTSVDDVKGLAKKMLLVQAQAYRDQTEGEGHPRASQRSGAAAREAGGTGSNPHAGAGGVGKGTPRIEGGTPGAAIRGRGGAEKPSPVLPESLAAANEQALRRKRVR